MGGAERRRRNHHHHRLQSQRRDEEDGGVHNNRDSSSGNFFLKRWKRGGMFRWALLGLALCLAAAAVLGQRQRGRGPPQGGNNWRSRQLDHQRSAGTLEDDAQLRYFADDLQNERNFRQHLKEILIPRVPGTEGSRKVREVREEHIFFLSSKSLLVVADNIYSCVYCSCADASERRKFETLCFSSSRNSLFFACHL